jgi:hypothetical protein
VVADAGYPATATLQRLKALHGTYVFALPRTRPCPTGKDVRDVVYPLPKAPYRRRATDKPDGRRHDDGGLRRHEWCEAKGLRFCLRDGERLMHGLSWHQGQNEHDLGAV